MKNPNVRYVFQGIEGIDAISEFFGINEATIRNRINVQGMSMTRAIALGQPTKRGPRAVEDEGMVFVKRKGKRRNITIPNFSELQRLAFGINPAF
ncbi:hypothetical protein [Vibrio algicola]|uniref:Uncharacterized protein n=1 Tax=Vibrio algicola TaxID=2662262 RepID=A0A5Q0TC51_9VIBR|nr:hypothetical protein [Vibrio algicola]